MGFNRIAAVCYLCVIYNCLTVQTENDVDNCVTNKVQMSPCSQLCASLAEGYACQCNAGYELADDNHTCLAEGSEPILFLLTKKSISLFDLKTGDLADSVRLPKNSFSDLAIGPARSVLLVGDNGTVVYNTSFNNTTVTSDIQPIIDTGLHPGTGVVIDWVTSNIYLVDKHAGRIVVCTKKGDNCSILIDNLKQPVSLTINTRDGLLLWSEWNVNGLTGSINSADLDGGNSRLVLRGLNQPYNLVIDSTLDLMYWLDTAGPQYVVQSAKINGEDKTDIMKGDFHHPSMALYADNIFIIHGSNLLIANKFSGHILKNYPLDVRNNIMAIFMYHDDQDKLDLSDNPCSSAPCSQVCLPGTKNSGYRCLCRVDEVVSDDGSCTKNQEDEKLLVSGTSGIYEVSLNYIGYHGNRKSKIIDGDISCIVYDTKQGRIFYFDDTRRAILRTYINSLQTSLAVYSEIFRLEDMAFDGSSEVLYWTTSLGEVHVGSIDGAYSTAIITDLDSPRGITLDPNTGYLYICDWGREPHIKQCHMDGSNCITFIHVDGGQPNMVVIATAVAIEYGSRDLRKTLYWTDSRLDMIGYIHLDGVGVSKGEFLIKRDPNSHPFSLVVSRDRIYFTDWNTRQLHYIQGTNLSVVMDIELDAGTLYSLDSTKKTLDVSTTLCSVDNGGCSHLCLIKPGNKRTCLCPNTGVNSTCTVKPVTMETPHAPLSSSEDTDDTVVVHEAITEANTIRDRKTVPARQSAEDKDLDTTLLAIILVSAVIIITMVILILVFIHQKRKHERRNWMLKFIQYVKTKQTDDGEGLVSNSTSTISSEPSFKQFEDVDYPEDKYSLRFHGNDTRRDISIVSVDSAFNEMKEFDNFGSSVNLRD